MTWPARSLHYSCSRGRHSSSAVIASGEALAIHLEAVGLLAGSADALFLGGVGSGGHEGDVLGQCLFLPKRCLQTPFYVLYWRAGRKGVEGVDEHEALKHLGQLRERGKLKKEYLANLDPSITAIII